LRVIRPKIGLRRLTLEVRRLVHNRVKTAEFEFAMSRSKRPISFERAYKLLSSHDPENAEEGCRVLGENAVSWLDRLIEAYEAEQDQRLRRLLLWAIGDAESERAFPVLEAAFRSDDVV
jgi:hypothetical protein